MAKVRIKRGTRAQIEAAATAGALAEGEPYLLTDEGRFAVGMGAGAFAAMAKQGEGSINAVSGFRNKIINGSMEIAQRGAVFPGVGAGVYCLVLQP